MSDFTLDESTDQSLAIAELSEDDLDGISAGRGGHHGMRSRGRGGSLASRASFSKRSLSISGQTIVKPDGTSITSFSLQLEEIHSEAEQLLSLD
jgi:hypothetical protein